MAFSPDQNPMMGQFRSKPYTEWKTMDRLRYYGWVATQHIGLTEIYLLVLWLMCLDIWMR
jgi:hypothetical protein